MNKLLVSDLTTDDKHIVSGINWQRKNKVDYALKFNEKADRAIKFIKENSKNIRKIMEDPDAYDFIVGVMMYSQKSLNYVPKKEIIRQIKRSIKPELFDSDEHLQHLKMFYMMSAGESNGGRMRNLIGKKGNELFCRYIFENFDENEIDYSVVKSKGNIQSIETEGLVILFNKKPKFINKSIDFIVLLKDENGEYDIENPKSYISAGELKSGIDPSGADEHWKTATTALKRIRDAFKKIGEPIPDLYFIGGAISKHMAEEIIEAIDKGGLQGAANLNEEEQVVGIAQSFLEKKLIKKQVKKRLKRS